MDGSLPAETERVKCVRLFGPASEGCQRAAWSISVRDTEHHLTLPGSAKRCIAVHFLGQTGGQVEVLLGSRGVEQVVEDDLGIHPSTPYGSVCWILYILHLPPFAALSRLPEGPWQGWERK
jgi:hypothetical protein